MDERCFSRPRPPSPLNGDNRAVLYVQMTTHRHTQKHTHTQPGNCSGEADPRNSLFKERVDYATKHRSPIFGRIDDS